MGSAYVPATIDPAKATRSSSESSFLDLGLGHTTLKVYDNSVAQRILLIGSTIKGVSLSSLESSGVIPGTYVLNARKEVIVSASTFQSPQLHMMSGISPRQILDGLSVPVVKELWAGTDSRPYCSNDAENLEFFRQTLAPVWHAAAIR